ncbi:MAG: hypothetical protein K0S65_4848, partial [Labilithrix sp.]|nr:hypothetical protein [Labilithrix sp.]
PLAAPGYLGIYNANALFREGDSGGINNGKGESAPSLMDMNVMGAVNGYTRGAWGWLDRDGDGIIEVRDTFPKSQLEASVTGQTVRLTGQIVDVPESPMPAFVAYSVNHLTSLNVEIERGGIVLDAIDVALPGDTRGRQSVDIPLPPLPQGEYVLRVRSKNEVGNVEPRPFVMQATVGATGNTPPIPHLTLPDAKAVSSAKRWSIKASAVDLDGDVPQVRIDLGADGTFDTSWEPARTIDVTPPPGVYPIVVEARDPSGATASTRGELFVFDGNAPPTVRLDPVPSLVHGTPRAALDLTAVATDPEGGALEYSWLAELATNDGVFRRASGWGPSNRFSIELPTPDRLVSRSLSLAAGDDQLGYSIDDVLPIGPSTIAVAAGWNGVWFLDVTDPAAPTMLSRIQLETSARKLWRDHNRLYVLGSKLTIVDISDLGRPTEIRQLAPADDAAAAATSEEVLIGEDAGATHYHDVNGDRIRTTEIRVKTDHAQPADLRVVLHPPRVTGMGPITLRDKEAAPAGVNTWTFSDANTPALAALHGLPASDNWRIEVVDDVSNRIVGTLLNSRIEFQTRSFGAPVLPGANEIVGKLWSGDLVLAGRGVQVLSVSQPTCVQERSRLGGLLSVGATLEGPTVVMATTLKNQGLDEEAVGPVKGIVAVDLSIPTMPRVVQKVTPDGDPSTFRRVGSRAYVQVNPTCERGAAGCEDPKASTLVIKTSRFANGSTTWKLGESALLVDSRAFGNDQALWTVGSEGYAQRYDVTDPANLRVGLAYPQNLAQGLLPVGPLADGSDLLLFDGTVNAMAADRDRTMNVLSRVYHLTVEARDAAGAVTREYRTVHVNPYDHAPTISRVEREDSTRPGEGYIFSVIGSDPDGSAIWNRDLFFRVDWDGDGVFDTSWTQMAVDAKEPWKISKLFEQSGTYQATFEIRDGYYASQRFPYTIVVP